MDRCLRGLGGLYSLETEINASFVRDFPASFFISDTCFLPNGIPS